ncbi:Hsp20/alpha crystallin family protein [Syntrophobacter fumaroxidans]|uniref:Heat shock protein Hsp20 n=1 Tax=Syntrophobacter fumaroxidans (strain DSM 10017 / MPOB) TaxID=335543 RepID=A0LM85_SYNFM|nr:Hsp20 family protein [Syntrophobacter fumaroxidans]ABK18537.1 heat shock protein Hsp20 [Syntrophobacter fumaroxidans MPOB]
MDFKKLAPWNWFKKEEEQQSANLPVQRYDQPRHDNPVARFHQEIDRMFDHFFRGFGFPSMGVGREIAPMSGTEWLKPMLDIAAGDKEYTITVELPGVDEKDVQLELQEDTLIIKGEKRQEKEEKDKNYYRMERSYGSFQRVLSLPEDAEQEGINAAYKHGILTITIPRKARAVAKPKQVVINRQ